MIKNIRLILGLLLAVSSSSLAAVYVRNGANESWGTVAGWNDNSGGPFAVSTVLPGASDAVTVNAGENVALDVNASISSLTVVNNSTDGTLYMTNNNTMGVTTSVAFGNGAGAGNGTIIQSDGALTAANLIIGNVNSGAYTYTQSGGTVSVTLLRIDAGNTSTLPCLYNLSGGSVTTTTFQNFDADGNSYFNFATGGDGTLTNGTLTVNSTDYDFATFIDAGKIRQGGVTVTSADASWNVDTNVVGKTTLSVVIPEEVAVVFQENSVFPDLDVLASQLENNNVGSVRYTAASGGQNSGLGQSFEFGSATALRV